MAEVQIGSLINKLLPLLDKEVREILKQLVEIHFLLKDADKREEEQGDNVRFGIKAWVQELREIAFQIEDLVTEYTHHVAEQPPDCDEGGFGECARQIASFLFFCCSRLIQRHVLAVQIRQIKARFKEIHERGMTCGFLSSSEQGSTSIATQNVVPSYDP